MTSSAEVVKHYPESAEALQDMSWEELRGRYQALAQVPLDAGSVEEWLAAWSRLESLVSEAASTAMIRYTCDTTDQAKEATHLRFAAVILPKAEEQSVALARKLVASGFKVPGMETVMARFSTAIALFREENVVLFSELEELGSGYQKITGAMTAEWEGRRVPLPQLSPFLQSPDRAIRERAYRATVAPYVAARGDLAGLFNQMRTGRQQVARNAGFANYRDYIFPAKFRFDYTPDDCRRFHDAVEAAVIPAVARSLEERRVRLGVDRLRPWDLAVNPYRLDSTHPFQGADQLIAGADRIFSDLDPGFAEEFRTMRQEGLLDLDSRHGKAPGGYCDTLHVRGRPFIFMNASGVVDDVMTLLHEAGHAFHAFASHRLPFIWQRHPGSESAELASMSMELLAGGRLGLPGGYLGEVDARRAQLDRLEDVLATLGHIASIDAFQHWIYTDEDGADPAARDAAWLRIRARFEVAVDWDDMPEERAARWYRQLHVFLYPFYYIEYGIAQLGALQVWRNSLADPDRAVRAYRDFLSRGATRPLPELYRTAGASLVFDPAGMAELVSLVEEQTDKLRAGLPPREVALG